MYFTSSLRRNKKPANGREEKRYKQKRQIYTEVVAEFLVSTTRRSAGWRISGNDDGGGEHEDSRRLGGFAFVVRIYS